MSNPRTLKIIIGVLLVALVTAGALLVYSLGQNYMWKQIGEQFAAYAGSIGAKDDFQRGRLRLFVFRGERDADAYSGTNNGPFEIWYSQSLPKGRSTSQLGA